MSYLRKNPQGKKVSDLKNYIEGQLSVKLPLYSHKVRAGQPSATDSHVEAEIDLTHYLAPQPSKTFLVRAEGDSMIGVGIQDGSLLVINKTSNVKDGDIVIASIDGELTVKRLYQRDGVTKLKAENPAYSDIILDEYQSVTILGVVIHTIHSF